MCVWVLLRLQIESPIHSEKDFTSANRFIEVLNKWNDAAMNFWQFFFQILSFQTWGAALSASAAYTPMLTIVDDSGTVDCLTLNF